jgi:hypothetical protein
MTLLILISYIGALKFQHAQNGVCPSLRQHTQTVQLSSICTHKPTLTLVLFRQPQGLRELHAHGIVCSHPRPRLVRVHPLELEGLQFHLHSYVIQ